VGPGTDFTEDSPEKKPALVFDKKTARWQEGIQRAEKN
jgi:hypothetical protein